MGEIADDHYDRFCQDLYNPEFDDETDTSFFAGHQIRTNLVCRACGATGMRWTATRAGWKPGDGTTPHECKPTNTTEGFDDVD